MRVLRNGSKKLIKEINRFKVLNIIRHQHPISRGEISKQYKLGVSTLSYIIEDLKSSGLIYEVGESTSTGGRRAKLIEFNKDFGSIISVKIEEKQVLLALTNMDAEIIAEKEISFGDDSSPESVVNILEKGIHKVFESCDKDINNLLGIGILSSGLVSQNDGSIIRSSMLGWSNVPITNMLQEKFEDVQIFVDNNINGYTLAELSNGEGQKSNNFLVVSVGAGIGLSVVIDRKIYYGALGGAGEFGHTSIVIDGYDCHCGQRGCLEMYASEFYFENKGRELIEKYPDSKIENFNFSEVAEVAEQDDELAKVLVGEMSHYLGYGVRNLINTFNPEKIVIAGEGMKYGHLFMDHVQEIAQKNFFSKVDMPTQIVASKLSKESWLTGGALLAINHIFQEPVYEKEQTII
ncbi:XylR family transcriptional regulator [Halalkalibacillus sediminis]|uniref:XylR family transcriptional regulator n=1 Tax=Halalkalibacillus sediminis TaxID=2018042 RepID=A0A2I0QU05_9BACI|nr:ROK family protein [Halalkalibacillus sediminis]PKR77823.1 XylR family transcriptional regulator [Halalkalibacillus sediminis]